jgi:hypothetical protein
MSAEQGSKDGAGFQLDKILSRINIPEKRDLTVSRIYDLEEKFFQYEGRDEDLGEDNDDLRSYIEKEIDHKNPIIRGPIRISKGNRLILAITSNQEEAFANIYRIDFENDAPFYALVESVGKMPRKEEALIKIAKITPKYEDNLVISSALANKLRVKTDQDIRILRIYQKPSDINLDELP